MESHPQVPVIVPSLALAFNLTSSAGEEQSLEKARVLAPLLRRHGLPATWVIAEPRQAIGLGEDQLATTAHEVALTADARSPQRLRSDLANRQAAVQAASGHEVSVIVGDPQQLRARTALLADLGIRAVVSDLRSAEEARPPRLLPCGLWQLDPTATIPQPRSRWSLLPTRRLNVEQLLATGLNGQPVVVAVELGQIAGRALQDCERLLQELAEAVQRQSLSVVRVSEMAAELASRHEVKPQRSILRRAA